MGVASQVNEVVGNLSDVLFVLFAFSGPDSGENRQTGRKSSQTDAQRGQRGRGLCPPPNRVGKHLSFVVSPQDLLPAPTLLPTIHELDLFRSAPHPDP